MKIKTVLSLLFLLIVNQGNLFAQSITVPEEVRGKPNRPIFITPIIDGDDVQWEVDERLDDWVTMLPPDLAAKFGSTKIFYGPPGTYLIKVRTAKAINIEINPEKPPNFKAKLSKVYTIKIIIEGDIPPVPPIPPNDPLTKKLQDAYQLETDSVQDKLNQKQKMIDLYSAMSDHVKDKSITKTKDLLDDYSSTASKLLSPGILVKTRTVVANELIVVFGSDPKALDDDLRGKGYDLFRRLAKSLGEVK